MMKKEIIKVNADLVQIIAIHAFQIVLVVIQVDVKNIMELSLEKMVNLQENAVIVQQIVKNAEMIHLIAHHAFIITGL